MNKLRSVYYFISFCAYTLIISERLWKQEHIFMNDDTVSSAGILMRKEQITIIALSVWLTLISLFMLLTQRVDFEIFFILSLIGILIIKYTMESSYVQPDYERFIWYLIAAGIVIFGVIAVHRVMEIIGK